MNLGTIKDKTGKGILRKHTVKKAVSLAALSCVAILAVTTAVSLAGKKEETPVLEQPKATATQQTEGNVITNDNPPVSTPQPTASALPESTAAPASTNAEVTSETLLLPISQGNVLKGYAEDSLLYSKTLNHWATHTALDISAPAGTLVLSAQDGTVTKVVEDQLMGLTVTIEHSSGLETVYASLESVAEEIKEGANVLQGQTIGAVGNSAASEATDGAHLHFEVIKDGKNVNPQSYLSGFTK